MKNIAIIGAGASGIFCALLAIKKNPQLNITLYEQSSKLARKVLASGNGHCNISNQTVYEQHFYSQNPDFVSYALEQFSFKDLENFLLQHGMLLHTKDDGRAYPHSNEAKSVVTLFNALLQQCNINITYEEKIESITKDNNLFSIHANTTTKTYDAVVIATGSEAAAQLGGNRSGYALAQSFGHTVVDTYPSLVQLHLEGNTHTFMNGVRVPAKTTLYIDSKKQKSIEGDVLFTKYGISGLSVLDVSHDASLALSYEQSVTLEVNLLPQYNTQQLAALIQKLSRSQLSIEVVLNAVLHSKIVATLLKVLHITPSTIANTLSTKTYKQIASQLQFWRFNVNNTHGFKHAEVSGGGVSTYEVNSQTYESLLVENLYFIGEVLDVVGERGGYNFHFCWASAYCCAMSLNNKKL